MPFNLGYVPLGHKLLPFAIFGETWHTKQRYEHITMSTSEDQHHHLSDAKLLLITCIKKILSSQFVTEIYKDDFNAFRLSTQIRLLPEFVKV